jgi:hypothetical protein
MKRWLIGLMLLALVHAPSPAAAQSLSFFGDVNGTPIFVLLERAGDKLSGWYIYTRQARQIRLEGTIDANDNFALEEFSFQNGKKTGSFKGQAGDKWAGTWSSPLGMQQFPFSLGWDPRATSELDGKFTCQSSVANSGFTFVSSLTLTAARGKVTQFSFNHTATGNHDEQACSIGLDDLKQVEAPFGILLRNKDDGEKASSEDQDCKLRLLASNDYLVLLGPACKGAAGTMFCSGRGSWSDVIFDRRSKTCKTIQ